MSVLGCGNSPTSPKEIIALPLGYNLTRDVKNEVTVTKTSKPMMNTFSRIYSTAKIKIFKIIPKPIGTYNSPNINTACSL